MNGKRFVAVVLAVTLVCLGAVAGFVRWVDPLFSARALEEGETALFTNQRYEMAGLIRNQDYSAVVMGTSLVANYRASWFTQGLGEETLKITYPDGWLTEFDTALRLAFSTHESLDTVYFCLDPNILVRSDSERTVELPHYLYNENPLDDVEFYLNADSVMLAAQTLAARAKGGGSDLDSAYIWDGTTTFSKAQALVSYPRPEVSGTTLDERAYQSACDENLARITAWAQEHPDVSFSIWFPPYSILYWDKLQREGRTDAVLWAVEYAAEQLMSYDNVTVYSFLQDVDTITNLDNYTDHVHCSAAVTKSVAERMMDGQCRLEAQSDLAQLEELRQFVESYDYDALFD
jgi:hypothetical protein